MSEYSAILDHDLRPEDHEGSPALQAEKKMVLRLIAQWRRKNQHLLQLGCGSGFFLQTFLDAGFQVTGADRSPKILQSVKPKVGANVDLHLAQPEHLHFEDKEFDFAVLINILEFSPDPDQALLEACRVCKKSLLLLFLNRCSIFYLTCRLRLPMAQVRQNSLQEAKWRSWPEVKRLIRANIGTRPMQVYSVLPGPQIFWSNKDNLVWPLPVGTICAAELDVSQEKLGTPLLAWNNAAKESYLHP